MKKILIPLLLITFLSSPISSHSKELSPTAKASSFDSREEDCQNPVENHEVGQAASCSCATASAIAWGTLGISLLVAIGIIIAVTISKDKKCCHCHS